MNNEERFLEMMVQALALAASDYEMQIRSLPDFVFVPDEVALIFDEAYVLFDHVIDAGLVDEAQIHAVSAINNFLDAMSKKKGDDNPWTLEAMARSADWHNLRLLARNSLKLFHRSQDGVDLFWVTYVQSKRPPEK